MAFQQASLEIGSPLCGVGLDGSLTVLHHDTAVLVIGIDDGKSRLRQTVEKHLLGIAIVFECFMVIHVVASQVGEDAPSKLQTSYTLLMDGMTGTFHECIFASGFNHTRQQCIQFDGVGGGMAGCHGFIFDIIAYG